MKFKFAPILGAFFLSCLFIHPSAQATVIYLQSNANSCTFGCQPAVNQVPDGFTCNTVASNSGGEAYSNCVGSASSGTDCVNAANGTCNSAININYEPGMLGNINLKPAEISSIEDENGNKLHWLEMLFAIPGSEVKIVK